ncbi:MAG TPA: BrnA antitoxin family protein [Stellaceae bacterium]|nr:BrnA antitoxin family protein [Stellaceae bacterium]
MKRARLVMPERKTSITIRLDADIVRFFKREPSYQTLIGAVLRSYVAALQSK